MTSSKFYLLHNPELDFWGYQVISEVDTSESFEQKIGFMLSIIQQHNEMNNSNENNILVYDIREPTSLHCIAERRWDSLIENDFEEFHVISNNEEAICQLHIGDIGEFLISKNFVLDTINQNYAR